MRARMFGVMLLSVVTGGLSGSGVAAADVVNVTAGGFTVRIAGDIAAPPDRVYDALTNRVADWWNPDYTWSGDPRALSLEAQANGCFCEKLTGGGFTEILRVVRAEPGKMLRLSGAPGGLQGTATMTTFSWALSATATGTRVDLTIAGGGYLSKGFEVVATTIDEGYTILLARLRRFLETGKP